MNCFWTPAIIPEKILLLDCVLLQSYTFEKIRNCSARCSREKTPTSFHLCVCFLFRQVSARVCWLKTFVVITNIQKIKRYCNFLCSLISANEPPIILCPSDVNVAPFNENLNSFRATWPTPSCVDAANAMVNIPSTCDPPSGSEFSSGNMNTVICSCTNQQGIQSTCSFPVELPGKW